VKREDRERRRIGPADIDALRTRFEVIFQRSPSDAELHQFELARSGLVMRIPPRARRRPLASWFSDARTRTDRVDVVREAGRRGGRVLG